MESYIRHKLGDKKQLRFNKMHNFRSLKLATTNPQLPSLYIPLSDYPSSMHMVMRARPELIKGALPKLQILAQ
jgi:hypothetical protein